MKSITAYGSLSNKIVFLRADFNVPTSKGVITDDFRITKTLPLIYLLKESGAKVIIGSHFEGEEGSLRPVADYLKKLFPVSFIEDFYPNKPISIGDSLERGEVVLLENLRKYSEEKENSPLFAKHLASFADLYVNEAFSAAHREHASIIGIPKFLPHYAGPVFLEEVKELSRAFEPRRPFIFVLGGAKFDTKIPLVEKFFNLADTVFIGGALANDFFRAQGFSTGASLLSSKVPDMRKFSQEKLMLPVDVVVKGNNGITIKNPKDILEDESIVDVGPISVRNLCEEVSKAKFVLWNGPLGNFEIGFKDATFSLARCIAEASLDSIVGGGDTLASISELNLYQDFSFISTGGGAMLDFLANETLPGIQALETE